MPTYEYRCLACEHEFERFQKMTEDPVRTCPECGEDEADRQISPGAGLVFKGSGFYTTDYRDPPPDAAGREGGGNGSGGKTSSRSGESSGEAGKTSGDGTGSGDD